jgi:hypothetical protein
MVMQELLVHTNASLDTSLIPENDEKKAAFEKQYPLLTSPHSLKTTIFEVVLWLRHSILILFQFTSEMQMVIRGWRKVIDGIALRLRCMPSFFGQFLIASLNVCDI